MYVKGFLAYESGSEDGRQANSDEAQRILNRIRECMWRYHRGVYVGSSQDLQKCCGRVGLGRNTTLLRTGQGPYWLEVGYALGGRRYPCVVGGF